MESYSKETGPWRKPEKDDGGLQRQEPFLSFKNKKFHFSFWYIIASLLIFFLINVFLFRSLTPQDKLIEFSDFKQRIETGEIKRVEINPDGLRGSNPRGPGIHTSEKFRNVVLTRQRAPLLGSSSEPGVIREYAESTQTYVDEETARLVNKSYERALAVLKEDAFLAMVKSGC